MTARSHLARVVLQRVSSASQPVLEMPNANDRRKARDGAVRQLNEVAAELGVAPVAVRTAAGTVAKLFGQLVQLASGPVLERLSHAKDQWEANGGCELAVVDRGASASCTEPTEHARNDAGGDAADDTVVDVHDEQVDGRTQPDPSVRGFRLRAKAFMLTFNNTAWAYDILLWREFRAWVVGKATEYHAKYWSATVEESRHGDEPGRIHFHCYFSWHGLSASGVDRQTTDAWVFRGVSPRVDANAENRGPSWWLKAAQHGHFYVAVMKEGTLEADTNYPAWDAGWAPEA